MSLGCPCSPLGQRVLGSTEHTLGKTLSGRGMQMRLFMLMSCLIQMRSAKELGDIYANNGAGNGNEER